MILLEEGLDLAVDGESRGNRATPVSDFLGGGARALAPRLNRACSSAC
jgi:hypothetical protein